MLVLDNPGIGNLPVRIIDHGVALIVFHVQLLRLKAHGAVLQRSQLISVKLIDHACKQRLFGDFRILLDKIKIVCLQLHRDALQHLLHDLRITAHGNSLVAVVKVIVVIHKAEGKPLNNKGGKLRAGASPLLLCVALDQLFVHIAPGQGERLLLQVFRLRDPKLRPLLLDLGLCLRRRLYAPHAAKRVHIERQVVQLVLIHGHRGVDIMVKFRKLIDILPYFLIAGVENVGSVPVYVDAVHIFTVNISGDVVPLINHQAGLSRLLRLMGKHCPV